VIENKASAQKSNPRITQETPTKPEKTPPKTQKTGPEPGKLRRTPAPPSSVYIKIRPGFAKRLLNLKSTTTSADKLRLDKQEHKKQEQKKEHSSHAA
jgi:hypothetical protein